MHGLRNLKIWLLVASLHHMVHTCAPGRKTEVPFESGIGVSPMVNIDRNEVDVLLTFVAEPTLPLTSEYTESFGSITSPTTLSSPYRPIGLQTDSSPVGGQSTDSVVDDVLQAYKRVVDKISRGSLECKTSTTLLLRVLSELWAGRFVDSILHPFEPPSIRKSFANRIVKEFLSEELVPENDWLEHLEAVLCNSYYAIVKTIEDATWCNDCKAIADDIVFALFVEDLLTDILSSRGETHVTDEVGRLLEQSGISNKKQNVWKALFNQKPKLNYNKKVHTEGKKTLKQGLPSEKSVVAALFSGTVTSGGEKSIWELSPSDISSEANQKLSIPSDNGGTDFAPFGDFSLLNSEIENEITDEYFDFENNWKKTALTQSHSPLEGGGGFPNGGYSVDGYREFAHLYKDTLPATQDMPFKSTDDAELILITWLIPDDVQKDRNLGRKKHYHSELKENKTNFVDESAKPDTKMVQGSNCSLSVSKGKNEGNENENSQNAYTESTWSPLFSALGSWLQFMEKMTGSGQVESAFELDVGKPDSKKTNSINGNKLSLSGGNQRTGTSVITGETNLNIEREGEQISYEDGVAVVELDIELAKMISISQEEEEAGWNGHGEDKIVDTQTALGNGSAVNKTTESSILNIVTDFLMKIPEYVSNMARFITS